MSNQQSKKVLRELAQRTQELSDKSTKLSHMLEEAQSFLQQMPGKLEVRIGDLSFERGQGNWQLWFGDEQEGELVTESSVANKARAAVLLPLLVEKLFSNVSERLEEVDAGLEALSTVPFLSEEDE